MDVTDIDEMCSGLGPVTVRRMFGGQGIYHRGLIVAVVFRDEVLLKADVTSAPAFAAAGARRWTFEGQAGGSVEMPHWSVPEAALDDPDAVARCVGLAWAAALRAGPAKGGRASRRTSFDGRGWISPPCGEPERTHHGPAASRSEPPDPEPFQPSKHPWFRRARVTGCHRDVDRFIPILVEEPVDCQWM